MKKFLFFKTEKPALHWKNESEGETPPEKRRDPGQKIVFW